MTTTNYANGVLEISEQIVKSPRYVLINDCKMKNFEYFGTVNKIKDYDLSEKEKYSIVAKALISSSINFCYWYGKPFEFNANNRSSSVHKILNSIIPHETCYVSFSKIVNDFYKQLVENRFSMLKERRKNLYNLAEKSNEINNFCSSIVYGVLKFDDIFPYLFNICPELADDLFMKRAFLFLHTINREAGLFAEDIGKVPIPADYQIPKVLLSLNILSYDEKLYDKIKNFELIPKQSLEEIEIRASSIIACKMLSEMTCYSMQEIDQILFSMRKNFDINHHMTLTTDY